MSYGIRSYKLKKPWKRPVAVTVEEEEPRFRSKTRRGRMHFSKSKRQRRKEGKHGFARTGIPTKVGKKGLTLQAKVALTV